MANSKRKFLFLHRNWRFFVILLILIFPVFSNLITHANSVILAALTLAGLPFCFSPKKRPTLTHHEKRVMWAFVGYFAVYLLSFTVNGLLGNLEDPHIKYIDHELRMLFIIPIFFLLRRVQIRQWEFWFAVIAGAAAAGIHAIISNVWLFPGERATGSYHSIAFGDLALVMAFMSAMSLPFFRKKHIVCTTIPLAAFLLGTTASLLSGSRGAWIALPVFSIIMFFYLGKHLNYLARVSVLVIFCLLLLSAYKIPGTGIAQRVQDVFKEVKEYHHGDVSPTSSGARLEVWPTAWGIFKEHPLLGAGPGSFKPIVLKMIAQGKRSYIISALNQPLNAYLAAMVDCGVPGFIAILSVFLIPLWAFVSAIRQNGEARDPGYAGLILITGFMHFGLTESIFGRNVIITFYIIMIAVVLSLIAGSRNSAPH